MFEFLALVFILRSGAPVYSASGDEWSYTFLPENYSSTGALTNVRVDWELETKGILKLSALEMEFSIDIRLRIAWRDNRLITDYNGYNLLTRPIMRRIWFPFLEFTNCKVCHPLLTDPEKYTFLVSRKEFIHNYRQKVDFNCNFDLSRYPFDIQICQILVSLTIWVGNVSVNLEKEIEAYKLLDKKTLPIPSEYVVKDIQVLEITCPPSRMKEKRVCFTYKYFFERAVLQHVLVTFVPSILIVMLSWISFWLSVELAAPRVALGQTSLLTLAAQFNNAQRNLPSASSVKALDIWMFVCIFLAFASLVEFALAYNFSQVGKVTPPAIQIQTLVRNNKVEPNRKAAEAAKRSREKWFHSRSIDFWAKIIFPAIFFVFNVIFWLYYLGNFF